MKHLLALLIVHGIASSAFAQMTKWQCTKIDLSHQLGPEQLQGDVGWCFAYTASDMASVEIGKKISAVDIAMTSDNTFFKRLFNGSNIESKGARPQDAITAANKKGYCLDSNLRSDKEGVESFVKLYRAIENNKKMSFSGSPRDIRSVYRIAHVVAPNMTESQFNTVYLNSSQRNFFENFRDAACAPRIMHQVQLDNVDQPDQIMSTLNDQLKNRKIMAATISMNCLRDETEKSGSGAGDRHSVIVIGRYWDESQSVCKFAIRESRGVNHNPGWYDIWASDIRRCTIEAQSFHSSQGVSNGKPPGLK